ncbi:MAG: A/G-specific adenine glycosylase [Motilibacteraceae bacterium]
MIAVGTPGGGAATAGPHPLHAPVLAWYAVAARDLPWRAPGAGAWPVLVSEVMLQQTPVARVEPVWRAWLERWPTPAALAAEPPGEAVRAWGRLGYPRRALRLHQAAVAITERHGGEVPRDHDALRALPGVGTYTAAAVASFAFGQRHAVVDTNVRRVLARAVAGRALAAPTQTAAELRLAEQLVPAAPAVAARWAVAVMELGALVCTARTPSCGRCPVLELCAWQRAGCPPDDGPPRRGQAWAGTDRQVRGLLLALLRAADAPVPQEALDAVWPADPLQRARALDGLVSDGLVEPLGGGRYRLPGTG